MNWGGRGTILLTAVLVTLVAVYPFFLASPGGDVLFHYTLIDCFSRQFWAGDLYPRWCAQANGGLGSPVFLFYFPLPYYITALFWPLSHLGVDVQGQYALSATLATFVTFLTCRAWLAGMVSPGRAMLCALIYIFIPYRMEVMWFRTAFAELWCLAFMPLMFMYTRRVATGQVRAWPLLALSMMACVLCHVPVAFIGLLASVLQMLFVAKRDKLAWIWFAVASAMAVAAVAPYIFVARHFLVYLHPDALEFMRSVWVNSYIELDKVLSRASVMISLLVDSLFLLLLVYVVVGRREPITSPAARSEMRGWVATTALCLVLIVPLGAPLWYVFFHVAGIMTPWRAQALMPPAIIFLLAVYMQWLASDEQQKTWRCDYTVLLGLFMLMSLTMLTMRPPELDKFYHTVIDSKVVTAPEYRTRWTDEDHADREELISQYEKQQKKPSPLVQFTKGKAELDVNRWDSSAMAFRYESKKENTAILRQFYFPVWRMDIDGADSNAIAPQDDTGLTSLTLPAGKHEVVLTRSLSTDMGWRYYANVCMSLCAFAALGAGLYSYRRNRAVNA